MKRITTTFCALFATALFVAPSPAQANPTGTKFFKPRPPDEHTNQDEIPHTGHTNQDKMDEPVPPPKRRLFPYWPISPVEAIDPVVPAIMSNELIIHDLGNGQRRLETSAPAGEAGGSPFVGSSSIDRVLRMPAPATFDDVLERTAASPRVIRSTDDADAIVTPLGSFGDTPPAGGSLGRIVITPVPSPGVLALLGAAALIGRRSGRRRHG